MRKHSRSCDRTHRDTSSTLAHRGLEILVFAVIVLGAQGCATAKAMDVLWSNDLVDDNGMARNPVWSQMKQTGQPPDPCAFFPCQSENPQAWKAAANYTDQTLETNSSLECFGHWNWFPV